MIIPDTKTLFFYFQIDKQEEIFNNFEKRNYFIFQLITVVVVVVVTYFNQPTHLLTLILIVTDCHHSGSL